ncbi:MAG: glycosyltransferase [Arcanobacterium sp.]|nr:glycosyltransferase [Arcanobacterium sp.]
MPASERIVAVVVAYNRADLLRECLDALADQTRIPDKILVINNASTDATERIATLHPNVSETITLPRNTGGAGGFAAGIARAINHWHAAYVWIMDDDTIPTPTALAELLATRNRYPGQPALLASKSVWTNGAEHPMNRPRSRPLLSKLLTQHAHRVGAVPVRTASFVSILLDARAVREVGLPLAAYFLWNDDFEFTSRLLKKRVGLYVPTSVVIHKTAKFGNSTAHPGERFTNEVRNKLWAFRYSPGLYPLEKVLYGGMTALRWIQLLARDPERQALISYARSGFHQALTPPVPTTMIFDGTAVADDVRSVTAGIFHHSTSMPLPTCPASQHERAPHSDEQLPPFSVLMSTYDGDHPDFLRASLESVSRYQTLKPAQIVLVQDGPVRSELAAVINNASHIAGQHVDVLPLEHNSGLAVALDRGLAVCVNEIVARADADDISLPHRFSTQIPMMCNLDLLGSALTEFECDPHQHGLTRVLPVKDADIRSIARLRDPFNHPTVVLRKSAVLNAGGYSDGENMEDYWLFARMLHGGARVANVSEPLVLYRIGAGAYSRRGGFAMAKTELHLQHSLRALGFVSLWQYLRNLALRVPYRILPANTRKMLYHGVGKLLWFRR